MELRLYRQPIKEKVAARMKKKAGVLQDTTPHLFEKLTTASGLELAEAE